MEHLCFGCRKKIPWSVGDSRTSAEIVHGKLTNFLAGLRPPSVASALSIAPTPPNYAVFCESCWAKRMGVSEESITETGGAPPAQTLGTDGGGLSPMGISFAATHKVFVSECKVQYPRIIAILVHEMCHWYSYNHIGFQNDPGKGYWGINWDEMVTDYLAANIFPIVVTKKYSDLTLYNNDFVSMPDVFCNGFKACSTATGFKAKRWGEAVENLQKLNDPDLVAFYSALTTAGGAPAVGWYLSKFYFTAPNKVKMFFDCFDKDKTSLISNAYFSKSMTIETEDMFNESSTAFCAHGVKRPAH